MSTRARCSAANLGSSIPVFTGRHPTGDASLIECAAVREDGWLKRRAPVTSVRLCNVNSDSTPDPPSTLADEHLVTIAVCDDDPERPGYPTGGELHVITAKPSDSFLVALTESLGSVSGGGTTRCSLGTQRRTVQSSWTKPSPSGRCGPSLRGTCCTWIGTNGVASTSPLSSSS